MSTSATQVSVGPEARIIGQQTRYAFGGWQPMFEGVERAVGTADTAFGLPSSVIRKQYVNAVRVDLQNENVSFLTSDGGPGNGQTPGQTVTDFLAEKANSRVILAINANFSWPGGDDGYVLFGAAVRAGKVVCDPAHAPWTNKNGTCGECSRAGHEGCDVPRSEYAGAAALLITADRDAAMRLVTREEPEDLTLYHTAIAGSAQPVAGSTCPQLQKVPLTFVLKNGVNLAIPAAYPRESIAARTAVGLDDRYLYLLTLDGWEHSPFPYGGAFYDVGEWMRIAGARDAIPLDGGGSTIMAWRAEDGTVVHANIPYGDEETMGNERKVGNFFGVIAPRLRT